LVGGVLTRLFTPPRLPFVFHNRSLGSVPTPLLIDCATGTGPNFSLSYIPYLSFAVHAVLSFPFLTVGNWNSRHRYSLRSTLSVDGRFFTLVRLLRAAHTFPLLWCSRSGCESFFQHHPQTPPPPPPNTPPPQPPPPKTPKPPHTPLSGTSDASPHQHPSHM